MNDSFFLNLLSVGLDFFRTFNTSLQDDLMYSDDDDEDDEDEDDDDFYPCHAAYRPLEPHPRIRQLTDEVIYLRYK